MRSALAYFAEKRVSWHDKVVTEGVLIQTVLWFFVSFYPLSLQSPLHYYVLSFLKRKYERKQFRRHILLKDHL